MSGAGFVFWIISARLFTVSEVGLASSMISAMMLISTISMLGLNIALIRYLPTSKNKGKKIGTTFVVVGLVSFVLGVIFISGLSLFSPDLYFLKNNMIKSFIFILAIVSWSWFGLIESVFISLRRSDLVLIKNLVYSLFKVTLPIILIGLGIFGIFGSWVLSTIIAFLFSMIMLIKEKIRIKIAIYDSIIKKIFRFSFANYFANFLYNAPGMIFPLMITTLISPESTAYFYTSWMMSSIIFSISTSIANSLFAEGSCNLINLQKLIKKSLSLIFMILVPIVLIFLIFGQYLLLFFGESYSYQGTEVVRILAISSIFFSLNTILLTVFKITNKIKKLLLLTLITTIIILVISYILLDLGIRGVALAWLIGHFLLSLYLIIDRFIINKYLIKNPKIINID